MTKSDKLNFTLNPLDKPLYLQLFNIIQNLIASGAFDMGDKLPSVRNLSKRLNVNQITVLNAYKKLQTNGYILSKPNSGYYICRNCNEITISKSSSLAGNLDDISGINFASASPNPSIFPVETFKSYLLEVLDRDKGFAFGYQEINGLLALRELICEFLQDTYNVVTSPECIQIISGAQQGIDIIAKACLAPGHSVITENPTYNGAVKVFRSRGCQVVPVTIQKNGIDLVELEKKIKICKPQLLYIMPNFQNPTSVCYDVETMHKLIDLSFRYNFFIIEEDSMHELCYANKTLPVLKAFDTYDKVIYLKSFSKLLMPGFRMGFLIIPKELVPSFTNTKNATDISSSGLMQRALELYFRNNKWHEHINYMKEIYKGKYEFMLSKLNALTKYGIRFSKPKGGLYFWLHLPSYMSCHDICSTAKTLGLSLLPSEIFFSTLDADKDSYLRVSFAFCSFEDISLGFDILDKVLFELYSNLLP